MVWGAGEGGGLLWNMEYGDPPPLPLVPSTSSNPRRFFAAILAEQEVSSRGKMRYRQSILFTAKPILTCLLSFEIPHARLTLAGIAQPMSL